MSSSLLAGVASSIVPPPEAPVVLGETRGAFGIKGWVRLRSFCRPPEGIFRYSHWWLGSPGSPTWTLHEVQQWQADRDGFAVRLGGVPSREAALGLHGSQIAIPRAVMAQPAEDSYLWHDLIGLRVQNRAAEPLGEVIGLIETGAADVLEIREQATGRIRLIPFVPGRFVTQVDIAGGRLHVDWHTDD